MKHIYLIFLLMTGIVHLGCEKDKAEIKPVLPSDLTINVVPDEENPGTVTVHMAAEKSNFYRVYFGDQQGETARVTTEKKAVHTYTGAGNYTVKVQAHTTESDYISATQNVTIELPEEGGETGEIPETGFTSPESYEGMTLVWQDEFEGTALDLNSWAFETGTGSGGWGNNELQYYREENTTVADGYLTITAKKETFEGREYTSSRIKTQGKESFQYGRIDIRAALPEGQGIWPALWMLGENISSVGWPASGEIDIMELVGGAGRDNTVHGTIHWSNAGEYANYGGNTKLENGDFSEEFHVFSIVWDENSIDWLVDDVQFHTVDITPEELSEFHQDYFLIFNVAVGGNWPGSPDANTSFPQKMHVDYVRVFQEQ